MLGLASVGSTPLSALPKGTAGNKIDENESCDPTDYLVCPLQIAIDYCERACKHAQDFPSREACEMLVPRDIRERQQWSLDLSTKPSLTLGQIAKNHFHKEQKNLEHTPFEKAAPYKAMAAKAGNEGKFKRHL